MKFKQSILTWAFEMSGMSTEEAIKCIKEIGYDGVEIAVWKTEEFSQKRIKEIANLLDDTGLPLVHICCNCNSTRRKEEGFPKTVFTNPDKKIRKDMLDSLKKTMDIALKLKCNSVSTCFTSDPIPFQVPYREAWGYIIDFFKSAVSIAKKYKIRLSVEWKPECALNNDSVIRLLKDVNSNNLGGLLDTGHAMFGREHIPTTIEMLGDKLFHVHLSDNYGDYDRELPPGAVHNFEPYLLALKKNSYQGFLTMDIWPKKEPMEAARIAKEYINRLMKWM